MDAAAKYRDAALGIRDAIAKKLTDSNGAIAVNVEELASGADYYDAAVLDAVAMGLFHPKGAIAKATLKALDDHLIAAAGAGWSRNDDRTDHMGGTDVSPWGSEYDSAEWVVTDLRGAVATHLAGDAERSDRLVHWVRDQSLANFLAVSETYDENTGNYKFNAPMVGFGSGVFALAWFARDGVLTDAACDMYYPEPGTGGSGGVGGSGGSGGSGGAQGGSGGAGAGTTGAGAVGGGFIGGGSGGAGKGGGCGCRAAGEGGSEVPAGLALIGLLGAAAASRRRRRG
jgi:MYXO-CTERM domain-containing protein